MSSNSLFDLDEWDYGRRADAEFAPNQGERPYLRYLVMREAAGAIMDASDEMLRSGEWRGAAKDRLNTLCPPVGLGATPLEAIADAMRIVQLKDEPEDAIEALIEAAPKPLHPNFERPSRRVAKAAMLTVAGLIALALIPLGMWASQIREKTTAVEIAAWHAHRAAHCEQVGIDSGHYGELRHIWKCTDPEAFLLDSGTTVPNEVKDLFKDAVDRAKCEAKAEVLPWRTACSPPDERHARGLR